MIPGPGKRFQIVHCETGKIRASFSQKFRAEKYCHDLNVWLGGNLIYKVVDTQK